MLRLQLFKQKITKKYKKVVFVTFLLKKKTKKKILKRRRKVSVLMTKFSNYSVDKRSTFNKRNYTKKFLRYFRFKFVSPKISFYEWWGIFKLIDPQSVYLRRNTWSILSLLFINKKFTFYEWAILYKKDYFLLYYESIQRRREYRA